MTKWQIFVEKAKAYWVKISAYLKTHQAVKWMAIGALGYIVLHKLVSC